MNILHLEALLDVRYHSGRGRGRERQNGHVGEGIAEKGNFTICRTKVMPPERLKMRVCQTNGSPATQAVALVKSNQDHIYVEMNQLNNQT